LKLTVAVVEAEGETDVDILSSQVTVRSKDEL